MTRYDNLNELPGHILELNSLPGPGRRAVKAQEFKAAPVASEHDEQAALFQWATMQAGQVPELDMLLAIPNGQYRRGQRPEAGIRAGVPDVMLPVPRGRFAGLFIELKIPGNTTTADQDWWLDALERHGYKTAVCYGYESAKQEIENYLEARRHG